MNLNRVLSGLLAVGYVIYAFTHFTFAGAMKFTAGLLLPLLCIWFSEAMGDHTGFRQRGFFRLSSVSCRSRTLLDLRAERSEDGRGYDFRHSSARSGESVFR
jgi:hypothetical protein